MVDERHLRKQGDKLVLGGISYCLEKVEGKGGSAVMYRANYEDELNRGIYHQVYIKELYPRHPDGFIFRNKDGTIGCKEDGVELMEFSRTRFRQGNIANLELLREMPSEISGNINSFEAYGTYYSILSIHGGEELQQKLENNGVIDLREAAVILWKILDALECFHNNGLLHLDISPDNILLTPTQALLIDYNSVWLASDIENPDFAFSYKEGYSAPEILLRNISQLGKATDLYSVCAVFFWMLSGKRLSEEDIIGNGLRRCFAEGFPILEREPSPAKHKVMQILAKGLHTLAKMRYQSVKELRAEVKELINRIDRKGVSAAAIWESNWTAFHRMRKEGEDFLPRILQGGEVQLSSLQELQDRLEQGSLYLLKGAGGIGKTRLLLELWEQNMRRYLPKAPIVSYISLKEYQTAGRTAEYIRNALLKRLDFDKEYGHYEDARHELEKIIDGASGAQEKILLLLDGLNESGNERELLIKEIEELGEKPGIAILITDRTEEVQEYALQSFQVMELLPLSKKTVVQELEKQGLEAPEDAEVSELLGNPMMLALYKSIMKMRRENHTPSADGQSIHSADEMVELYLQNLCKTQMRVDAGDEKLQLSHRYAIQYLLPGIADDMARKDRTVLPFDELFKLVKQNYHNLQKNTFGICFREYLGKSRIILEGIQNETEWFDLVVGEFLIRDLNLLIRGEGDNYRLLHDSFLPFLAEKGKGQRLIYRRQKKWTNLFISAFAMAILIPGLIFLINKWQTGKAYQDIDEKNRQIQADIENEKMISALYGMKELSVSYPKEKYSSYIQEQIGQSYLKANYRAAFTQMEEVDTMGQYIAFDQSEKYVFSYHAPEDGKLNIDIYDLELQPVRQIILEDESFSSKSLFDIQLKNINLQFAYHEASQEIEALIPPKKLIFNMQGESLGTEEVSDPSNGTAVSGMKDELSQIVLENLEKEYGWDRSYMTPDIRYAIGVKERGIYFSDIEIYSLETWEMKNSVLDNIGSVHIDFTYYDEYGWVVAGNNGHDKKAILSGFTIPDDNILPDFRSFTINQEEAMPPQFLYGKNGMVYILEHQPNTEYKNRLHMVTVRNHSFADQFVQINAADEKISLDLNKNCLVPDEKKKKSDVNSVADYEYKLDNGTLSVASGAEVHRFGYGSNQYSGVDIECVIRGQDGEQLIGFLTEGFCNPYYNEEDQVFGFVDYTAGEKGEAYTLYSYQDLVKTIK